jgi:hypothetical protein
VPSTEFVRTSSRYCNTSRRRIRVALEQLAPQWREPNSHRGFDEIDRMNDEIDRMDDETARTNDEIERMTARIGRRKAAPR